MTRRLVVIAALLLAAFAAHQIGLFEQVDRDTIRTMVLGAGVWGPVLFVALFSILQPFGFPGLVFMLTSVAIWSFPVALFLNWCGAMGAGITGFGLARLIGREWVERRLPALLLEWDERLSRKGLRIVIVYRVVFFLLSPAHWALGLSRVRISHMLLGSAIGLFPGVVFWSWFGGRWIDWLEGQPGEIWVLVACAVAVLILMNHWRKIRAGTALP